MSCAVRGRAERGVNVFRRLSSAGSTEASAETRRVTVILTFWGKAAPDRPASTGSWNAWAGGPEQRARRLKSSERTTSSAFAQAMLCQLEHPDGDVRFHMRIVGGPGFHMRIVGGPGMGMSLSGLHLSAQ